MRRGRDIRPRSRGLRDGCAAVDACGWSNCCHDGVTTSVSRAFGATTPGMMLRLGDLASHRRGRPPPLVGAWALTATGTPARVQVELEKHNKNAGASAGLHEGLSYPRSRALFDPDVDGVLPPVTLRAGRRSDSVLSLLGALALRRRAAHRRGLENATLRHRGHRQSAYTPGRQRPTPACEPCSSRRTQSPTSSAICS